MKRSIEITISIFVSCYFGSLAAHHGIEEYEFTENLQIEGEITSFQLIEPHSVFEVEVDNEDGTVTSWTIESMSASVLAASDITEGFLRSKPSIMFMVIRSIDKSCTPSCRANAIGFSVDVGELWRYRQNLQQL